MKNPTKVQLAKITEACESLGLTFLDAQRLVKISDDVPIAAWGRNESGEYIFINPALLSWPVKYIEYVIRHEVLHWAGYASLYSILPGVPHEAVNLALDVVVNRVLQASLEDTRPPWNTVSAKIYPKESQRTVLVLAQSHIDPKQVPKEFSSLWNEVWRAGYNVIPSPPHILYKILSFSPSGGSGGEESEGHVGRIGEATNPFPTKQKGKTVFRQSPPRDDGKSDTPWKEKESALERAARVSLRDPNPKGDRYCHQISKLFNETFVKKESFDLENIRDYVQRIEIVEKLDEVISYFSGRLSNFSALQPYPLHLSRRGIFYVAAGISGEEGIPLFWGRERETLKPSLGVYIDTSPSMEEFKGAEVYLVEQLQDIFPTQIFLFAGSVTETDLDTFANGTYRAGWSTYFDAVVNHLIDSEFEVGVMFTDGESGIEETVKLKFEESGKRLYVVYFTNQPQFHSPSSKDFETFSKAITDSMVVSIPKR